MLPKRFRIGKRERYILMMLKSEDKPISSFMNIKGWTELLRKMEQKGLIKFKETKQGIVVSITPLGKSFV